MNKAKTLGELKASGYASRSVKDEMRANLIKKLRTEKNFFPAFWVTKKQLFRRSLTRFWQNIISFF